MFIVSRFPHHLQAVIVFLTISFEEVTEVKKGAMQSVFPVKIKGNKKTAKPAVTVKKRMYGLKLVGMYIAARSLKLEIGNLGEMKRV